MDRQTEHTDKNLGKIERKYVSEKAKKKLRLTQIIPWPLLLCGVVALLSSIVFSSSVLAFIGLGLTFWGALLLFIRPVRYVKSSLLGSTTLSALTTINQIIAEANSKEKAIYLPPRRLEEIKSGRVFIPSKKEILIPTPEEVAEEKIFLKNPKGICLTPPGVALANLFEDTLGTSFTKVDLDHLQNILPKLFIEDLEIAENLEINTKSDQIHIKITGSIYQDFCKEARKLSNICGSLGCPVCSSFACALTRTTGKPIIIEKTQPSQDGKTIEAYYKIIEE